MKIITKFREDCFNNNILSYLINKMSGQNLKYHANNYGFIAILFYIWLLGEDYE